MAFSTRVPRRHLPTVATGLMVVWLAAVCVLSTLSAPTSARPAGAHRLVRTALATTAGRPPQRPPIPVDAVPARAGSTNPRAAVEKADRKHDDKKRNEKKRRKKRKKKKKKKPRMAPGHALPLPRRVLSAAKLRARHHDYPALDIAVRPGVKVRAVTPGRVKDTTGRGACGKGVIIKGKDGFTYTYCHGNKRFVGPGKWIDAGEPIMASGNTGNSTGPHLHLQISKPNGRLVCPQDLLPAWVKGERKTPWKAASRGCHTGDYGRKHKKRTGRN